MSFHAKAAPEPRGALYDWECDLEDIQATEVEIAVEVCALCHSDLHLIDNDWGISQYPLVPGHEIVGRVTSVGSQVTGIHPGDRVGLGWQCGACGNCPSCLSSHPHLCTGGKKRTCVNQYGGFAERVRGGYEFVYPIPDSISTGHAAPLLCAGLTVFSALERHVIRKGMKVGIIGVGGLGHLAVQFAAKMGSHVVAFDVEAERLELARRLGAEEAFLVGELPEHGNLDLLLSTTSANLDWDLWLDRLALNGTLCLLGYPSHAISLSADRLLDGQKSVTGSVIGSPATMRAMLSFAAAHGIRPMVEEMPISRINEAIHRLRNNDVRFRIVLKMDW